MCLAAYKTKLLIFILTTGLLSACGSDNDNILVGGEIGNACEAEDAVSAVASAVPPGGAQIAVERVFPELSFELPVAIRQEPQNGLCWYIVEKAGRVLAFENNAAADAANTFIDISTIVESGPFEAGLLGIAFHPDYANNGEVFLSYTGDDSGLVSYISRFTTLDGGLTLDPASEEIILQLPQPFDNHNGGNILFGPDGYLYIGFGDGGSGNDPGERAQNTMNLFGAILRIDIDSGVPYSIPSSNPFFGNTLCSEGFGGAACPEIYAWGLRNPWRWSFDRDTGDLWLGDVGQRALEEIDIIDLGGNYGWPFFEGTRCNTEAPVVDCDFVGIPPVTEYGRDDGVSVTGGYVYRGSNIPDLFGVYVYGDAFSGNLFQYFDSGSEIIEAQTDTGLRITAFGEDSTGELFLTHYETGEIYQVVAAP